MSLGAVVLSYVSSEKASADFLPLFNHMKNLSRR